MSVDEKTEPWIEAFYKAVYPEYAELAMSTNNEKEVVTHATEQLTALRSENEALKKEQNEVLSREASLCDYINTACREHGASEAKRQEDIKFAFHEFWMRMMAKLEAAEKEEKNGRKQMG